jgi:O-antigen ligase
VIYVFVQIVLLLQSAFADAEQAWQIARGRVAMNEMLLLIPALWTAAFAARAERLNHWLLFAAAFAIFAVGVLLTQWRAYYIDLALGLGLLMLALRGRERGRLVGFIALGLLGVALVGVLLFSDLVAPVALGLADRILSIGTATQTDISLLNRLLETAQVWELIKANPIVGYGLGVEFGFYDAISRSTWVKTYVHNGYLMLWYKFGVLGLVAILLVWFRSIGAALRTAREAARPAFERTVALFAGISLISILPSHAVSATFVTGDTVLMFAVLTGLAAGLEARTGPATDAVPV